MVSWNERRERKGIPFQPRFRDRTKAGQFKQLSASQSGRQKPCSGCLRNRIDETVFQAVRSPGNINYKRKEQWKSFHPRHPSTPRRRHCLRCTPIFVSTTVQGQRVFDGDEENSQTAVSCLSAYGMKEEEEEEEWTEFGKDGREDGCSRSTGQPTVTETVRRRPSLFCFRATLHVPAEF